MGLLKTPPLVGIFWASGEGPGFGIPWQDDIPRTVHDRNPAAGRHRCPGRRTDPLPLAQESIRKGCFVQASGGGATDNNLLQTPTVQAMSRITFN